jgi:hypothetical protein
MNIKNTKESHVKRHHYFDWLLSSALNSEETEWNQIQIKIKNTNLFSQLENYHIKLEMEMINL